MTETTLLVSASNIPMIKYNGIEVRLADLLKWKIELSELNVDLNKIVVFADLDTFSAFQRSLLAYGISQIPAKESVIPLSKCIEFCGLNVYENEQIVMKVYVYEFFDI